MSVQVVIYLFSLLIVFVARIESDTGKLRKTDTEKLKHLKYLLFEKKDIKGIPRPNDITNVTCDIYVNSFDSISESSMDFTVTMMLYLLWLDPRMQWISNHPYNASYLELERRHMGVVWQPDLYFPNEKTSSSHDITSPNLLIRVYRSGKVFYANRITLTLSCPMDLRKYPLDVQKCSIEMQSFGYTDDRLRLIWAERKGEPFQKGTKMAQFKVVTYNKSTCIASSTHDYMGNRSCLGIKFTLARNMGYYVVQIYVPSVLIVMLSWVSFWLNVESVPARISMGVLTVLTMTTQSSGSGGSLPRVSYTKAIDIWMSTCLVFVFAALIEFAIANVFARKDRIKGFLTKNSLYVNDDTGFESVIPPIRQSNINESAYDSASPQMKQSYANNDGGTRLELISQASKGYNGQVWARRLDLTSRVLFPLTFGLFNLLYWVIYLYVV